MGRYVKIIYCFIALMLVLAVGAWAGSAVSADGGGAPEKRGPQAVFLDTKYEFKPLFEGEDVTHDFLVENRGDAPLVIKNVKPG